MLLKKNSPAKPPIEQIIEFKLRGPGPLGRYMYNYNWLFSWQNKISEDKSLSGLLSSAKILKEAMYLTSAYLGQIT